jgi:carotenoid 1,2-hydratase
VDAVSDDGRHALTLIAFIGSVFSPYYARSFRRDAATDPVDHCALNVCLYGGDAARWTMTERARRHVTRDAQRLVIGPSALAWQGDELRLDIDECSVPLPRRVRGTVRVQAAALARWAVALDDAGAHRWVPIAPVARIEVDLQQPRLRWRGRAYLDSNEGDSPVAQAFERWDWLRATAPDGRTTVIYDTEPADGRPRVVARQFALDGSSQALAVPDRHALPPTRWWRIDRQVRAATAADGQAPRVQRTLEDTPFYARSLLALPTGDGHEVVHETLDARRLRSAIVQGMLPFRMPRRW